MSEFDPTRLMPGATGRHDKIEPGMRIYAEIDDFYNTDSCIVTEVLNQPTRNIRVVTSAGDIRLLSIWQVRSTLPTSVDDVVRWADA